jgi:hypothetical protein
MKNIDLALREMADRADEQLMPDPQTLRRQIAPASRRRRRTRTAAWVAAAAAVAVVVGVSPQIQDGGRSAPSPTGPVGSAQPTPLLPADAWRHPHDPYPAEDGWVQIKRFGIRVGWRSVVFQDGTYVAVGNTIGRDGGTPVWWSTDGLSWNRVKPGDGPATTNVWDVFAAGDRFVALAVSRSGSTPWISEDGRTWRPSDSVPDGFRAYGIGSTRIGLVAWGRGGVWISSDGARTWTAASDEPTFPRSRYSLNPCWVEDGEDGLQAIAMRNGGGPNGTAVRWTSPDGLTWKRRGDVDADAPLLLCGKHTDDRWLASGPDGTVGVDPFASDDLIFFRPADES